ncbi:MAG: V-type ATP synthase subunit E [Blautia wexlerae]
MAAEQQRLSAEVEAEAARQLERDQGAARMAARRQLLETKQALVDKAFRQAEQQLRSLPQAEYEALCAHPMRCGASTSGCEELIFRGGPERVGAAVTAKANELLQKAGKPAQLTLSAETRLIRGGVVLKNGLIETNCSLGTLADRPAAGAFRQGRGPAVWLRSREADVTEQTKKKTRACRDTDYLFVSAYLRAKEPQLLSREKAGADARLLGAGGRADPGGLRLCGRAGASGWTGR